jgi:ParB family transcriptional regulator, chromosome partitioning protein
MMSEHRRGLGRGLSALLEETEATVAEPAAVGASVLVAPIELLRRNPDQPRRSFPDEEIDGLAASIREKGLLQPILVRPAPGAPGEYQIVAGERRWRAAQRAGLREAPIIIRELDDAETLEIAILENVQREDLNPMEEAGGYKALIERFGRTQEAVAQVVGKSRSHIANTLRLLALPEPVQDMVIDGRLSAGHARAIMTADNPSALARAVVERGLNVRETEAMARQAAGRPKASRSPSRAAPVKDADTRALENDLADVLGLAVEVLDQGGIGEVRIRYATLEQLDDLCRRLTRT